MLFIVLIIMPVMCWCFYNIGKENAYDECLEAYNKNEMNKFLLEKERL